MKDNDTVNDEIKFAPDKLPPEGKGYRFSEKGILFLRRSCFLGLAFLIVYTIVKFLVIKHDVSDLNSLFQNSYEILLFTLLYFAGFITSFFPKIFHGRQISLTDDKIQLLSRGKIKKEIPIADIRKIVVTRMRNGMMYSLLIIGGKKRLYLSTPRIENIEEIFRYLKEHSGEETEVKEEKLLLDWGSLPVQAGFLAFMFASLLFVFIDHYRFYGVEPETQIRYAIIPLLFIPLAYIITGILFLIKTPFSSKGFSRKAEIIIGIIILITGILYILFTLHYLEAFNKNFFDVFGPAAKKHLSP